MSALRRHGLQDDASEVRWDAANALHTIAVEDRDLGVLWNVKVALEAIGEKDKDAEVLVVVVSALQHIGLRDDAVTIRPVVVAALHAIGLKSVGDHGVLRFAANALTAIGLVEVYPWELQVVIDVLEDLRSKAQDPGAPRALDRGLQVLEEKKREGPAATG